MRALLALAASLLLPLAVAGAQPGAPGDERYTPRGVWQDDWSERFYEQWYARQLRAMQEPILQRAGSRERFRRRLRLLVVPSFRPAWAVRVDQRSTGDAWVRTVELSGSGGYEPGVIRAQQHFSIPPEDVRLVDRALHDARLATLAPDFSSQGPTPDGGLVMCPEATQFVFELVEAQATYFVRRDVCDLTPELMALVRVLSPLREP